MLRNKSSASRKILAACGTALLALCVLAGALASSDSLLSETLRVPEVVNDKTETVRRDRFVKTATGSASVVNPQTIGVAMESGEGIFVGFTVRKGELVKAGDVLATYTRDPQAVRHETLRLSLARAQEALAEGVRTRQDAMTEAREALGGLADPVDRQIALLRLERMGLELERFTLEQERSVAQYEKQLAELLEEINDTAIVAPFDGVVSTFGVKTAGDVVRAGEALVTIYAPEHVLVRVSDTSNAFRYGMEVTVLGGNRNDPAVLSGRVIAASNILPYELRQQAAYVWVDDAELVTSLRNISASCDTVVVEDVLVVDRNALIMQGGLYYAQILEEDMVQKRYVITSSHRLPELWVLQGLNEGQKVLVD